MQIIIPHVNTDLDAIGAAVGVQILYPDAVIVLPGNPAPLAAEFISLHRYNLRVVKPKEIDLAGITRAIVVDTADPDRLGPLAQVARETEVHLYDHHPSEADDLKATLEVRDSVGATCTLIAELLEEAGAPVTPLQATAMLLGIYADTGSLSLMGTTHRDARAAAFLLSKGANLRAVNRFVEPSLTPQQQALLYQLQNRSRWLNIHGARILLFEAETPEYVGGLSLVVHLLQDIHPAHALFAVVRMRDRVYLVGRSEVPWVDVAKALAPFGGGGHPPAASAVVKGAGVEEVSARLEEVLAATVQRPVTARDVMSSPVKSIPADRPIRDAERVMLRYGHSGLPVVDATGKLVGVVSLRDVTKARRHGLEHAPVKAIMVRRVVTVSPDTPLDEVQDLMIQKDIGRVPVVEGDRMVGIISRSDLLGQLYGGPAPRWHRTLYIGSGTLPASSGVDTSEVVQSAMASAPGPVQELLRISGAVAERTGVAAYAVGGFVRDLLLGRPNLDIDIVVEGDGIAYARALAAELGGRVKEVPRFGTAHILLDQAGPDMPRRLDVATARREFYEHAAALPVVEHADLRQDLYRRDFSINAMAVRLGSRGAGELIDFFGGLQDLRQGQIRILHTLSFVEDPTRILRAVRFAHRYGFRLEPETQRCATSAIAGGYLARVTAERLRQELVLILKESCSGGALKSLHDLGALPQILPGVMWHDELAGQVDRVDKLPEEVPAIAGESCLWLVKLMVLLHPLRLSEGAALVRRMKLRRAETQALVHTLTWWRSALEVLTAPRSTPADVVQTLSGWPPEGLLLLYLLGAGSRVMRYWQEWRHVRLEITGKDLVDAGVPEGPVIRRALARALRARLEGLAPDRATQLRLALRYACRESEP
ncbi:MAG TPA: CBS domain-containing protein [Symbiobacteriaceae bacterium]